MATRSWATHGAYLHPPLFLYSCPYCPHPSCLLPLLLARLLYGPSCLLSSCVFP
ncbi:hypothetical protein VDGL01_12252 [Verticillium dahliae]